MPDNEASEEHWTTRPARAVPSGWSCDPRATLAAQQAFEAGHDLDSPEVLEAAVQAVEAQEDAEAEETESDAKQYEQMLRKQYFTAICNAVRGVSDLSDDDARRAAATLQIPVVTFDEWVKRIGG